jgi:replication-associated recombination protein RarA
MLFNKQMFDRIYEQLDRSIDGAVVPLKCDRWIASSLLQKSIRRSDADLAYRAGCRFLELDRSGIWRRLIIIAFEDVGVRDVGALIDTVFAIASTECRRTCGEASVLKFIVRRLAEAPKDRSGDYLICAAHDHGCFSEVRDACGKASLFERLQLLLTGVCSL